MSEEQLAAPRTAAGRMVQALLADGGTPAQPGPEVVAAAGEVADNDDSPALIIAAALSLAARRRFGGVGDVREITRYLERLHWRLCRDRVVDRRGVEAMLRAALGEPYLADDLDPAAFGQDDADFMLAVVRDLGLSGVEWDRFVAQAEALALRAAPAGSLYVVDAGPEGDGRCVDVAGADAAGADGSPRQVVRPETPGVWRRLTGRVGGPRTTVGRWLRACILQDPSRDELKREVDRAREQGSAGVLHEAFVLALRMVFREDEDVRRLAAWVRQLRGHHPRIAAFPHMELEAVVREGLGEKLPLYGMSTKRIQDCQLVCISWLTSAVGLSPSEADALLAQAERAAGM